MTEYTISPKPRKGALFFDSKDAECCYPLIHHISHRIIEQGFKEMTLFLAEPVNSADFFFCRNYGMTGEKGSCGRMCEGYQPRNGKSGVCKHFGRMYENTGKEFKVEVGGGSGFL